MRGARLLLLRMLAAWVRHGPSHPGKWRLANRVVKSSSLLKTLQAPLVVTMKDGVRLKVDGTSQTGRIAWATGEYEVGTTRLIRRGLRPGDRFVDVGANIGYFSIVAAKAVGSSGNVLAFEPVPAVRDALAGNLRLNGVSNVQLRGEALAADAGEVALFLGPPGDTGLGSLRPLDDGTTVIVRKAPFDTLVGTESPVKMVKIDVEGAELQVLQGMVGLLRSSRPDLIIEFTDAYLRGLGSSAESLYRFLVEQGYQIGEIVDAGPPSPIGSVADLARRPSQFNAYCSVTPWDVSGTAVASH